MARTTKKKPTPGVVGRQAPTGAWTPDELLSAFDDRTDAQRIEALKAAGIIDASGKITKLYKSWGNKVTRTPDADA
jgi:hypothetical protein